MKNFMRIICIFAVLVCANSQVPEELKTTADDCRVEVGLPENPELYTRPLKFDNPKEKCFSACILKKTGVMENGKINVEKALANPLMKFDIHNADTKQIVISCIETGNEKNDECEVVASVMKCVMEKLEASP